VPTILLIRHGQASYGTDDYDRLSDTGHAQARAIAAELGGRGVRIERIVCGSLLRQRDTAAPTAEALSLPVTVDPRLDEYDMDEIVAAHTDSAVRTNTGPDGEPVSSREFQRVLELGMTAWLEAGDEDRGAESWPTFAARCRDGLVAAAAGLSSGSTAVVFTSAGVIAALCCSLLGLPPKTVIALNRVAVNGSVTKVASGRSGLSLVSFNEHGYLEGAGAGLVTLR
jgi:broad specificity phosphatase PhoE